jgi:hypothetical protein
VVNGATEKTSFEIPQVSEEFIMYGLLMFIWELNNTTIAMQWTTICPVLFENFPQHLIGVNCMITWNDQVAGVSHMNVNTFQAQFKISRPNSLLERTSMLTSWPDGYYTLTIPYATMSSREWYAMGTTRHACSWCWVFQFRTTLHCFQGYPPIVEKTNLKMLIRHSWVILLPRCTQSSNTSKQNIHSSPMITKPRKYPHNKNYDHHGNANQQCHIQDNGMCPLPGHSNHKWGKCHANAFNCQSQLKQQKWQV